MSAVETESTTAYRCANCGAPVASKYCGECGQRGVDLAHPFGHFIHDAVEDLAHADSRLWRTLFALVAWPGYLTREYLDGRRARYLPPVRLYLVLSVAFFLVAGLGRPRVEVITMSGTNVHAAVLPAAQAGQACGNVEIGYPLSRILDPQRVRAACQQMQRDGGRSLREATLHNVPRAMFIFLPLIALLMKLLYRRPARFYLEHLLFLIHNHAFVFLLFALCALVALTLGSSAGHLIRQAAVLYAAWYLYRAMRRVYRESRLRTIGKMTFLAFSYAVSAGVMLLLTSLYSFESLGAA